MNQVKNKEITNFVNRIKKSQRTFSCMGTMLLEMEIPTLPTMFLVEVRTALQRKLLPVPAFLQNELDKR